MITIQSLIFDQVASLFPVSGFRMQNQEPNNKPDWVKAQNQFDGRWYEVMISGLTPEVSEQVSSIIQQTSAPPMPNWAAFRASLGGNSAWKRVLGADIPTALLLSQALWGVQSDPSLAIESKQLWDQLVDAMNPAATQEEIESLNLIASQAEIPLALDSSGKLILLMI